MQDNVYDVAIIGAGISGIGAVIRLLEADFFNIVILEKAADLGGTWRDNHYPGCECDVPSALYSYSFAPKPDWSRLFAGQAEILGYVRETAERANIERFIQYEQPVERAEWDESAKLWRLQTPNGSWSAKCIISASGYLHEPILPNVPGIDSFNGKIFHSARWDHEHDLSGERVAVIGTGASAIQFVPKIQPKVARLTLFQRTPQWVLPKPNPDHAGWAQRLFGFSTALEAWRSTLYNGFESLGIGFRRPAILGRLQNIGLLHLRFTIKDKALRKKLTPDYTLGCKRLLLSNAYYPAVSQPNVELVAAGVREIRGNTVIGTDGSKADVDTIILGTGFHVTEPPIANVIFDGAGRSLAEYWRDRMSAYRGTTITGFPNAFMVLGPNLGIGHNSAFIVIESQINYAISALKSMRAQGVARIEVKADVQAEYNTKVQRALQNTVWNTGGCSSYYLDKNGYNSVGFPWSTFEMRRLLARFDMDSYEAELQSETAPTASA